MTIETNIPILVVVADGRYNCFSLHPIPTTRDLALAQTLMEMGGVSEDTKDGSYHFNAEHVADDQYYLSLEPVK